MANQIHNPRKQAVPSIPYIRILNQAKRAEIGRFLAQRSPPLTLAQWHGAPRLIRTCLQSMGYSEKSLCHGDVVFGTMAQRSDPFATLSCTRNRSKMVAPGRPT